MIHLHTPAPALSCPPPPTDQLLLFPRELFPRVCVCVTVAGGGQTSVSARDSRIFLTPGPSFPVSLFLRACPWTSRPLIRDLELETEASDRQGAA